MPTAVCEARHQLPQCTELTDPSQITPCPCGEPKTALHLRSGPVLRGQRLLDTVSRREGHST